MNKNTDTTGTTTPVNDDAFAAMTAELIEQAPKKRGTARGKFTLDKPAPVKAPAAKKAPAKAAAKAPVKAAAAKKAPAKAAVKAPAKKAPVKAAEPVKRERKSSAPKGHPGHTWLALMIKANLSQQQTADGMGVAGMTLNRLINGHGIPTAKVTVRFARAVGADVQKVWGEVAAYELAEALASTPKVIKK